VQQGTALCGKNFLTPLICLSVTVPLTFLVIGPLATGLGELLAAGFQTIYKFAPGWRVAFSVACGRCDLRSALGTDPVDDE
jgi:phosphotransferase system  glucose/maltose/N-acetylglucosamine-specific IIC component